MSDPVKQLVAERILEGFRAMNTGAGFYFDWDQFYDGWMPTDPPSFPALGLLDEAEGFEQSVRLYHRTARFRARGLHRDLEERAATARRLIADMERAVMVDITLAGISTNIRITNTDTMIDYPDEGSVCADIEFEVKYRTDLADPTQVR